MSAAAADARPLPASNPDPDHGPRRTVVLMIALMVVFLVVALLWAAVADLDVTVTARGAVTPPSRLQEVQSLEGGIVEEMLVSPGQTVRKGQLLARLDTAQYDANVGESRHHMLAALAGLARCDALLSGTPPRFDADWAKEAPELIEKETQLWRDALREYQSAVAAAREAIERHSGEISEATARIQLLSSSLKVAEEAFAIEDRLYREGAGSRADFLSAQQRLLAQRTELEGLQKSLPRLRAGLSEAQATANEVDARARAQWGTQRSEFQTKAAALGSTLAGQQDKVARRDIISPMDGVVNRVLITTRGGVAQPGKPILEVVPIESELVMTVRVQPPDIGFIRPGQQAHVRVLAYDASTFGRMDATVTWVGADAVLNEKGEPYFEAQLSAVPGQLKLHGKPLPVTPGMPVEVGILTGERSVMQYLLKPVLRGLQSALQER